MPRLTLRKDVGRTDGLFQAARFFLEVICPEDTDPDSRTSTTIIVVVVVAVLGAGKMHWGSALSKAVRQAAILCTIPG